METIESTNRLPIELKKKWFKRFGLWTTGVSSYYIFTYLYDYLVVSFLLVYFGFAKGVIFVMILSLLIDFGTLKFYDWFKKDWLAIETLKDLQYKKNFIGRLFNFVQNKSTFVTVIVLSLTSNAFIVTSYMRKGSFQYNGLTKRDWYIFFASSFLTNLYWVFAIMGGIGIIKYLYQLFINLTKVI